MSRIDVVAGILNSRGHGPSWGLQGVAMAHHASVNHRMSTDGYAHERKLQVSDSIEVRCGNASRSVKNTPTTEQAMKSAYGLVVHST